MKKKKWPGWMVLVAIVFLAGVALTLTDTLTKNSIADQNLGKVEQQLKVMFPEADEGSAGFEAIALSADSGLLFAYTVRQGGNIVGYAAATEIQGYGGPFEVTAGMDTNGVLKGISVGGAEFKETEGLGSKAKEDAFRSQFVGKAPPLKLNDEIDVISGATITSRAVVEGVNAAAEKLWFQLGIVPNPGPGGVTEPTEKANRTANASVIGYAGPVLVQLTVDSAGMITAMTVGRERFMETEGVGSKVKDEAFTRQFIGQKPPLSRDNIDMVSGATISSQAALDAVNAAYAFLNE